MFRRDDRDDHKNDEGKIMVDRVRREEARIVELADFATETAKFSLWIAEYQMNEQFKAVFGSAPALPLKDSGNIV
ncbi:MAG TPA: DNA methyltransferase, partial [Chthoniobacterales bacterium]